ncbi:aldo/keto reductase [Actinospica durhamensis]|uniref:Aldo/keto reductase n=1 Tax=Actinospica durhamensis TaxID=1508375 RepID=A0A941ELG9_9ACTN|nr:aldo/keto reductase [Actinospica durhamensis]MBR7833316.1 aldo/keto reductase [Actinospica durhamensis]
MELTALGGPDGPRVSTLCLGTLPFGGSLGEAASFAILDRFREAGGTFLDTANCYPFWREGCTGRESEQLLGRWLASRDARAEMVIGTKLGAQPITSDPASANGALAWSRNAEGLSRQTVAAAAQGSLGRLGIERIDVLFAHIEDRNVELAETVAAFAELIERGIVGVAGVSNHPTSRVRQARAAAEELGVPGYRVVQQRHSFLRPNPGASFTNQEAADDELLAYVAEQPDLSLMSFSSLQEGSFVRDDRPVVHQYQGPQNAARIRELRHVAAQAGVTPNQLALAWLLRGTLAVIPVLGVTSVAQLDEALGAYDVPLQAVEELRTRCEDAERPLSSPVGAARG